jgi:hypothetical protein
MTDDERPMTDDEVADAHGVVPVAHSQRFRKVANGYPRRVAEAYSGDITRAALDSDEQVAERVAAWERANGREVQDWPAIGRSERGPDDEEDQP